MKHIVWAVAAVAFIFAGTAGYSRGFSVGVFGAYSIDGGAIEETLTDKNFKGDYADVFYSGAQIPNINYDAVVIPGTGLFTVYTFGNGFSIRTGAEYYTMVSGGNISKDIYNSTNGTWHYHKYDIEYNSYVVPLLLGITLSPDKGRTNIYSYAGIALSIIEISQNYSYYNTFNPGYIYEYESENKTILPGFTAIIGTERRLFSGMYVMLEFAFYKCDENREESGDYYFNGLWNREYKYTERYGLPRQQARIGVKFQF